MKLAVIGADAWFVEALRSRIDGAFRLAVVAEDAAAFRADPGAQGVDIAILAGPGAAESVPLLAWARRHAPDLRVVVKVPALRPDLVRNAVQGGAWGVFSAEEPPETVLGILSSVAQGRVSFPYVDFATLRDDPFERLTRREVEVLKALAEGWTNRQISARLGISPNTVKYHLKLIYDKLGVANRSTAVAQYLSRER